MKTIYKLLILLLLTSCSKGYYAHIPRTKTTVKHSIIPPIKEIKDTVYYQIIAAIVKDTIEKLAPKAIVFNELPLVIKDSIKHLADTNKKYIKGDPERGLKARTLSKVLTPIITLFSIRGCFSMAGSLIYESSFYFFGSSLGLGVVIALIALLVHRYQKKHPLFNRPIKKRKKLTFLRVFMFLAVLLFTLSGITGTFYFFQSLATISGFDILLIPQAFLSLILLVYTCYLWFKMLWREFSY